MRKQDPSSPTTADGNCAFHAIFGERNNSFSSYRVSNVDQLRKKTADFVRKSNSSEVFKIVKMAIRELIMHGEEVSGAEFKKIKDEYQKFCERAEKNTREKITAFEEEILKNKNFSSSLDKFAREQNHGLQSTHEKYRLFEDKKPAEFKKLLESSSSALKTAYQNLMAPEEIIDWDKLIKDNAALLREYAASVEKDGRWMLAIEFELIGRANAIGIDLYQSEGEVLSYNKRELKRAAVWFDGINHFEKIEKKESIRKVSIDKPDNAKFNSPLSAFTAATPVSTSKDLSPEVATPVSTPKDLNPEVATPVSTHNDPRSTPPKKRNQRKKETEKFLGENLIIFKGDQIKKLKYNDVEYSEDMLNDLFKRTVELVEEDLKNRRFQFARHKTLLKFQKNNQKNDLPPLEKMQFVFNHARKNPKGRTMRALMKALDEFKIADIINRYQQQIIKYQKEQVQVILPDLIEHVFAPKDKKYFKSTVLKKFWDACQQSGTPAYLFSQALSECGISISHTELKKAFNEAFNEALMLEIGNMSHALDMIVPFKPAAPETPAAVAAPETPAVVAASEIPAAVATPKTLSAPPITKNPAAILQEKIDQLLFEIQNGNSGQIKMMLAELKYIDIQEQEKNYRGEFKDQFSRLFKALESAPENETQLYTVLEFFDKKMSRSFLEVSLGFIFKTDDKIISLINKNDYANAKLSLRHWIKWSSTISAAKKTFEEKLIEIKNSFWHKVDELLDAKNDDLLVACLSSGIIEPPYSDRRPPSVTQKMIAWCRQGIERYIAENGEDSGALKNLSNTLWACRLKTFLPDDVQERILAEYGQQIDEVNSIHSATVALFQTIVTRLKENTLNESVMDEIISGLKDYKMILSADEVSRLSASLSDIVHSDVYDSYRSTIARTISNIIGRDTVAPADAIFKKTEGAQEIKKALEKIKESITGNKQQCDENLDSIVGKITNILENSIFSYQPIKSLRDQSNVFPVLDKDKQSKLGKNAVKYEIARDLQQLLSIKTDKFVNPENFGITLINNLLDKINQALSNEHIASGKDFLGKLNSAKSHLLVCRELLEEKMKAFKQAKCLGKENSSERNKQAEAENSQLADPGYGLLQLLALLNNGLTSEDLHHYLYVPLIQNNFFFNPALKTIQQVMNILESKQGDTVAEALLDIVREATESPSKDLIENFTKKYMALCKLMSEKEAPVSQKKVPRVSSGGAGLFRTSKTPEGEGDRWHIPTPNQSFNTLPGCKK